MRSLPALSPPCAAARPRCDGGGGGGPQRAPARRTRNVLLSVRGVPLMRYTLPDFFPDLNAREDATVDLEPLEKATGARPYRWQRSVLAGVERTAPRQRPLEPQQQAPDGEQPPPQPQQLPLVAEAPGPGSIALAGLTVLFYAAALALTLARGFVESGPAILPQ